MDNLQTQLQDANTQLDAMLKRDATIDATFANHKQGKEKVKKIEKELPVKEALAENWKKLNQLFGSASGSKFKEIAQGYTLDVLLTYANKHLQELSKRYELKRIPETLGLEVIDLDMLGEIRSVHTLSGGESFLVSLALALGLSSLSSNRMALTILFSIFPWTENIAKVLFSYIVNPIKKMLTGFWNYLPDLMTVIVIIVVFHYVLKGFHFLKTEIEKENLRLPSFYPEWANPTYQIIRIFLYAFMLVAIFPYLPGSDSHIFQGVSVFLGFLFTFGSSGSISNIVAGFVITYMSPITPLLNEKSFTKRSVFSSGFFITPLAYAIPVALPLRSTDFKFTS